MSLHVCADSSKPLLLTYLINVLLDFLNTVKAAPHECVIRTGQP